MSRLIKVIDNETIEIADYRNPEVIFKSSQNPPTLQDIKNEIEHLEWYCTFKDTINPFQMYEENKRLHSIIKEVREYIEHENFKRNILLGFSEKKYTRDILNKVLEILEKEK